MRLSIVVAFYNEEKMIKKTHYEIVKYIEQIENINSYELIYVNDGSNDKTLSIMKEISKENNNVKYISFSRNFGREGAILAGLRYSTGDAVMLMDGDLQHPPSLISKFLEAYNEGYDVVSGKRNRVGESKKGIFFAKLFYKFANYLMDVRLTNGISEFKLFSRKAVNALLSIEEYNRFSKGIFSWIGFKEKIIYYENQIRVAGESKFGFRKSLNYAAQGIISFNDKPLRICLKLGFICISLSILYIISLLYIYFNKGLVSGYFTTIAMIVLFGGVQLISIGILGEYIGKIFYEVKKRPHFLIDETNIDIDVKGEHSDK